MKAANNWKLLVFALLFFVACFVAILLKLSLVTFRENSKSAMLKNIGEVKELRIFPIPANGEHPLLATQDANIIQGFFNLVLFDKFSQIKLVSIKMPGELEFVTTGTTTQRLQLVSGKYLRSPSGLLQGDVKLTDESAKQIMSWLRRQGIQVPKKPVRND